MSDKTTPVKRLSQIRVGQRVRVAYTHSRTAEHRLMMCGLVDGVELLVEQHSYAGDLVVQGDVGRYHISSHMAPEIWVETVDPA